MQGTEGGLKSIGGIFSCTTSWAADTPDKLMHVLL